MVAVLTALVRKSRCAFVNGLRTGAGVAAAAASEPSFVGGDACSNGETVDEAFRDADMCRVGLTLWARLGAKKSSTGRRRIARRLEVREQARIDILK